MAARKIRYFLCCSEIIGAKNQTEGSSYGDADREIIEQDAKRYSDASADNKRHSLRSDRAVLWTGFSVHLVVIFFPARNGSWQQSTIHTHNSPPVMDDLPPLSRSSRYATAIRSTNHH